MKKIRQRQEILGGTSCAVSMFVIARRAKPDEAIQCAVSSKPPPCKDITWQKIKKRWDELEKINQKLETLCRLKALIKKL